MSEDLTPYANAKQVHLELAEASSLMAQLNQPPAAHEIRQNPMAGNSLYLPIAAVEEKLDYLFRGLWKTHSYIQQVIANEITGSLILEVFHPAGVWISRIGTAATLIQQQKGSDITDLSAKIKNTLVKDVPHLKAECIKNAAKSLGVAFGRDLNRDFETANTHESGLSQVEADVQNLHTVEELNAYWKDSLTRNQRADITIRNVIKRRKAEIQEGGES